MGQKYTMPHLWKEDEPYSFDPIKYHPEFGYPEGRPVVAMTATKQEMDSADLLPYQRDLCSHLYLQHRACINDNVPFAYPCKGLKHEWAECKWEHRIRDMKEFERERRLNARERRLQAQK